MGSRPYGFAGHEFVRITADTAALSSLPVLVFSGETEQRLVPFVPALIVAVGYVLARTCGRSRLASLVLAGIALVVGLGVASVKYRLSGH